MKIICLLGLFFLGTACPRNALKSLQRSLKVSDLRQFQRGERKERWYLSDKPDWNRELLLQDLVKLGFVNAVKPKKQHYQTAALLGATGPRMQLRIDYLKELWKQGVRFKRVVFLTGDRDLAYVDKLSDSDLAKNETELFKLLWARASLVDDLKKLPSLWIHSPKIRNPDGSLSRPTTASTIHRWRSQENIDNEDLLVFSNQPFVSYQECVLLNYLPKTTKVEVVGPASDPTTLIATYLDTLASCLEYCTNGSEFR